MKNVPDVTFLSAGVAPDWETLEIAKGAQLPHWTAERAIYHVCFRLADSVSWAQRQKWLEEREALQKSLQAEDRQMTEAERLRLHNLFAGKIDRFLDQGEGACVLRDPVCSSIVSDALKFFDGQRYDLHAWCVMPNQVHVVVEPKDGRKVGETVHGWTSFTSNLINRHVCRSGTLWQHEPYDHIIRSAKEYVFQVLYVWENPDKAGIKAARWRKEWE